MNNPEKTCKFCKHFRSFKDIYEDDLEPDECGWCYAGMGDSIDRFTAIELTCERWESGVKEDEENIL